MLFHFSVKGKDSVYSLCRNYQHSEEGMTFSFFIYRDFLVPWGKKMYQVYRADVGQRDGFLKMGSSLVGRAC